MMVSSDCSQHTVHFPDCDNVYPTVISLQNCICSRFMRFIVFLMVIVCSIVAVVVAIPLLLAAFVITRVLQFIYGCGYMYDKATELKVIIKLKFFLRTWIYFANVYLMCVVVVFYGVALIPQLGLHDVDILGYSILHWIKLYFLFFGICSLSYILTIISLRFVIFCIPLEYHTFKSGSLVVSDTVHEIIDCFILLLLGEHVIITQAKFLKEYTILGFYPVHTLFHVLVLLLVFHDLIGLSTHVVVWWLHKIVTSVGSDPNSIIYEITTKYLGRESLMYWANGLKPSIMFTRSTLMLLCAWFFYFRHLIKKHEHDPETFRDMTKIVSKVGTWTTICLCFFSIFWLIKNCILLELENRIVYRKFGRKISKYGKHLYFLGILGRGVKHSYDFLELRYDAKSSSRHPSKTLGREDQKADRVQKSDCLHAIKNAFSCEINKENCNTEFIKERGWVSLFMLSIFPLFLIKEKAPYQHERDPKDNLEESTSKKLCLRRKQQAREDLLKQTTMLYELQKKVQYFLAAKDSLLQDKYTSHLLNHIASNGTDESRSIESSLKRLVGVVDDNEIRCKTNGAKDYESHDWELFHREILNEQDEQPSTKYERLDTWLVEAHNSCVVLANKISSAKELVECLDKIMSVILIVLAFIVWLLLTGLTTTKGIILIGSPIISFSFIFGDTANIFFQGIVFVYAVHPFDVGDLCLIENNMLEVVEIGVWKTTFSKVETREEVIFPNLDLMNKTIVNHKTEFCWSDKVEIYVDSPQSEYINSLKQKIEKELEDTKYESKPGSIVEVMTTPENMFKIVVNFQYNTKFFERKSMNYSECSREKRKLRSEFVQKLAAIVEGKKNIGGPKVQEQEIQTSQ